MGDKDEAGGWCYRSRGFCGVKKVLNVDSQIRRFVSPSVARMANSLCLSLQYKSIGDAWLKCSSRFVMSATDQEWVASVCIALSLLECKF